MSGEPQAGTAIVDRAEEFCDALDQELAKPFDGSLLVAKELALRLNSVAMQLRMQVQTGNRAIGSRASALILNAGNLLEAINEQFSDPDISRVIQKMRERVTALKSGS